MHDCTGDTELATRVIGELGFQFLIKNSHRSKGAISTWKKTGMPRHYEMYLRSAFPQLRAFGGVGVPGLSLGMEDPEHA